MSGADTVGKMIAAANMPPEPEVVANIIFAALFETGPSRLSAANAYLAKTAIRAALVEWRGQLMAGSRRAVNEWKDSYTNVKRDLDMLMLQVAIWRKEGKVE